MKTFQKPVGPGTVRTETIEIYEGEDACPECEGWKYIANDEEGTSWRAWDELPGMSKGAIRAGVVRPLPCPRCRGEGREPIEEEEVPTLDIEPKRPKLSVDFLFEIGEMVRTPFKTRGIVRMLGFDDGGAKINVQTEKGAEWFTQDELVAAYVDAEVERKIPCTVEAVR